MDRTAEEQRAANKAFLASTGDGIMPVSRLDTKMYSNAAGIGRAHAIVPNEARPDGEPIIHDDASQAGR